MVILTQTDPIPIIDFQGIYKDSNTNLWVELTLENQLARRRCLIAYKRMFKFILNPCETLES